MRCRHPARRGAGTPEEILKARMSIARREYKAALRRAQSQVRILAAAKAEWSRISRSRKENECG